MEVTAKCAISLVLLAMLMALALPKNSCGAMAVTLQKNNGTTIHCSGRIDECLTAGDDMDLDLMMGLGVSRMLAGDLPYVTVGTEIESEQAMCGSRGQGYQRCTTTRNPSRPPEHCTYASFNRKCSSYD